MKVLHYIKWPLTVFLADSLGVVFSTLTGTLYSDTETFDTVCRRLQLFGLLLLIIVIMLVRKDD